MAERFWPINEYNSPGISRFQAFHLPDGMQRRGQLAAFALAVDLKTNIARRYLRASGVIRAQDTQTRTQAIATALTKLGLRAEPSD
jgi:hypothetical protein